jgi:uncharacterized membrane-anchored protein YitT (DUF2179 family)
MRSPCFFTLGDCRPGLAAVLFGVLAGPGLLALFRHGATLGGVGIVALWLQDRNGLPAGARSSSSTSASLRWRCSCSIGKRWAWSLLGAAIVNQLITMNHRRDRYVARS